MPTNLPSSFASAAAGQNTTRDARSSSRSDTRGSGDFSRRDGRPMNGTLTFRRSSTTPALAAQTGNQVPSDHNNLTASCHPAGVSVSEVQSPEVPKSGPYTRSQLLDIFKMGSSSVDVSSLFVNGWNPGRTNGTSSGRWTKPTDHVPQEPDVCWDSSGGVIPMGVQEMTDTEKELFAGDINAPIKHPQQKDGSSYMAGVNGRKMSTAQNHNSFSLNSPSLVIRAGGRRREPLDTSVGGAASPSGSRTFSAREEGGHVWPPRGRASTLDNAKLDDSDNVDNPPRSATTQGPSSGGVGGGGDDDKHEVSVQPSSARTNFNFPIISPNNNPAVTSAGMATMGSIWSSPFPASAGASSPSTTMGSFGNFALPRTSVGDTTRFGRQESRFASIIGHKDNSNSDKHDNPGENPVSSSATKGTETFKNQHSTDADEDDEGPAVAVDSLAALTQPKTEASSIHSQAPLKVNTSGFSISGLNMDSQDDVSVPSPVDSKSRLDQAYVDDSLPLERQSQHDGSPAPVFSRRFGSGVFDDGDCSHTQSTNSIKGLGAFVNNPLSGWGTTSNVATPDRERHFNVFGGGVFGPPIGDIHSPSTATSLGGFFGPTSSSTGTTTLRSTSKLGSLFPAAMQMQMQAQERVPENMPHSLADTSVGSMARPTTGIFSHDTPAQGSYVDMYGDMLKPAPIGAQPPAVSSATAESQVQTFARPTSKPDDVAPAQERTMVMPDRMRWVYLDPQGNSQGPFTGLEMNDWYKGNYFSADLMIKRVEDADFQPLGHLIRRIGNSREPFLVPQVGIPHGPPSQAPASGTAAGVVPPLPNAFPQFGRVLPADEQNNLERRKQEEQMKLARHRTFYQQPQPHVMSKLGGIGGVLQHHSSVGSLQSQPSFGNISSPIGPPASLGGGLPPAIQPNMSSDFFGMPSTGAPQPTHTQGLGSSSLKMLLDDGNSGGLNLDERLTHDERQVLGQASYPGSGHASGHRLGQSVMDLMGSEQSAHQVMPQADAAGVRSHLPRIDQLEDDPQGHSARLREFEQFQAHNLETSTSHGTGMSDAYRLDKSSDAAAATASSGIAPNADHASYDLQNDHDIDSRTGFGAPPEEFSVEQGHQPVMKHQPPEPHAWGAPLTSTMPMPFPPPPKTQTPLPAPTAQRATSSLLEKYNRFSETPDNHAPPTPSSQGPPPLAPWAPETTKSHHHKGPSLKEIQEAEERNAAKKEEAAAAQRRLALEHEAAALRDKEKNAAATAGLPTSSTWAHSVPGSTTNGNVSAAGAWSKPAATKAAVVSDSQTVKKKTLAEIQREEEAKKKMMSQSGAPAVGNGKLYAQLACKTGQPPAAPGVSTAAGSGNGVAQAGSGWTMVSASGKPKAPPPAPTHVSRPAAVTAASVPPPAKPASVTTKVIKQPPKENKADAVNIATEEFKKWVEIELTRGIKPGHSISTITTTLMGMPIDDPSLISDIIYGSSSTMDGRHFTEEFIRRKKLAMSGIAEKPSVPITNAKSAAGGGWNEVAKKGGGNKAGESSGSSGGADMSHTANFKLVAGRKKGGKK